MRLVALAEYWRHEVRIQIWSGIDQCGLEGPTLARTPLNSPSGLSRPKMAQEVIADAGKLE